MEHVRRGARTYGCHARVLRHAASLISGRRARSVLSSRLAVSVRQLMDACMPHGLMGHLQCRRGSTQRSRTRTYSQKRPTLDRSVGARSLGCCGRRPTDAGGTRSTYASSFRIYIGRRAVHIHGSGCWWRAGSGTQWWRGSAPASSWRQSKTEIRSATQVKLLPLRPF
jgi:hypothetical protein